MCGGRYSLHHDCKLPTPSKRRDAKNYICTAINMEYDIAPALKLEFESSNPQAARRRRRGAPSRALALCGRTSISLSFSISTTHLQRDNYRHVPRAVATVYTGRKTKRYESAHSPRRRSGYQRVKNSLLRTLCSPTLKTNFWSA